MAEDKFFVSMGMDVFGVEFGVEFWVNGVAGGVVGFLEEVEVLGGELEVVLFVAVGGEGFWCEDLGFRVCLGERSGMWYG